MFLRPAPKWRLTFESDQLIIRPFQRENLPNTTGPLLRLLPESKTMEEANRKSVAVQKFTEELESPAFKGGNRLSIDAGMGARSVFDLDALLDLVTRYGGESRRFLEQAQVARGQGCDWSELINQAITAQHKAQLSREAIETATNTGSWTEPGPSDFAKRENRAFDTTATTKEKQSGNAAAGAGTEIKLRRQVRPPRIVIFDDQQGFREIYRFILEACYEGVMVVECSTGDEAWHEMSRTAPDLFITDRAHTGMSCDEMLFRLAERKVQFPIILISAGGYLLESAACRTALEHLNFSFVHKQAPLKFLILRNAVEAALQLPARRTP